MGERMSKTLEERVNEVAFLDLCYTENEQELLARLKITIQLIKDQADRIRELETRNNLISSYSHYVEESLEKLTGNPKQCLEILEGQRKRIVELLARIKELEASPTEAEIEAATNVIAEAPCRVYGLLSPYEVAEEALEAAAKVRQENTREG